MIARPESLEKLLAVLRALPSVGPRMSERIAFHILKWPQEQVDSFMETILTAHSKVHPCSTCGYLDDADPCRICSDSARDRGLVCVVEETKDVIALSRVRNYSGVFHVLGGALSPLDGVGPQDLRILDLFNRIESGTVRELILALSTDMEGETTGDFIAKQLQLRAPQDSIGSNRHGAVKVSRLAPGLPAGVELEFADEITLSQARE